MNSPTNPKVSENQFIHPHLKAFARQFGEVHIDLACHAAFPLALTPELLYCLRENFVPNAPWIAVADILLFLCDPVGYQLYEMEAEVRDQLLRYLVEHFGKERLFSKYKCNLSDFMVAYIRKQLNTKESADRDLGAAPHWTALAYTNSKRAVRDIAKELEKALKHENPAEWIRLTPIIESYNLPILKEFGFEPLLVLARGWDAKARGDEQGATDEFKELGQPGKQLKIAGVTFKIPYNSEQFDIFPAHNSHSNSVEELGGVPPIDVRQPELQVFQFEVVTVNARGREIERVKRQAQDFAQDLGNNVTLEMVAIPGGTFLMGSPKTEAGRYDNESPQHEVTVPPFFLGKYPVTQAQWRAVAALRQINHELDPDPSHFKGDDRPVEQISWYEAVEFCDRLSIHTKQDYRLPSEAEWEYACRAGTTTPFHFGKTITPKLANSNGNYTYGSAPKGEYRGQTTPVGSFHVANAFGLYDMHGNVWEWCADNWHNNYDSAPTDGSAWIDITSENNNKKRLLRGGTWNSYPWGCRSACRFNSDYPELRLYLIGFRFVVSAART